MVASFENGGRPPTESPTSTRTGKTRVVAYASAFDVDRDAGADLAAQRALLVDFCLAFDHCEIDHIADVGWPDPAALCPPALFALLRAARTREVAVVTVEAVTRFARQETTAKRIAALLCDAGVQVIEVARTRARQPSRTA